MLNSLLSWEIHLNSMKNTLYIPFKVEVFQQTQSYFNTLFTGIRLLFSTYKSNITL